MTRGRSSRTVGSPPESWTLQPGASSSSRRYHPSISSIDGSAEAARRAPAKQIGHSRSQRAVTSSSTQQVCRT